MAETTKARRKERKSAPPATRRLMKPLYRGEKMQNVKTDATATAVKVYIGTRLKALIPEQYTISRRAILKAGRNAIRASNALLFLTLQNGFMYWVYSGIGERTEATFYIQPDTPNEKSVKVSKSNFSADYLQFVKALKEAEKAGAEVAQISTTKAGNVAIKAVSGIIAVSA